MKVEIVRHVNDTTDEVTAIEFSSPGEGEDFKDEIMKWLGINYPQMTPVEFLRRLMIFRQTGYCSISMV